MSNSIRTTLVIDTLIQNAILYIIDRLLIQNVKLYFYLGVIRNICLLIQNICQKAILNFRTFWVM